MNLDDLKKLKLIPSKKQFFNWSMPNKVTYIAGWLAIISIILTLFTLFSGDETSEVSNEEQAIIALDEYLIRDYNSHVFEFKKLIDEVAIEYDLYDMYKTKIDKKGRPHLKDAILELYEGIRIIKDKTQLILTLAKRTKNEDVEKLTEKFVDDSFEYFDWVRLNYISFRPKNKGGYPDWITKKDEYIVSLNGVK